MTVIWFEIRVQDMQRAKAFYESVFQIQLKRLNSSDSETWGFPISADRVGASGALVKAEGAASGGNSTVVYFTCVDCSVEASRAAEHGGHIQRGKFSLGEYGFAALIVDTEGNLVGLHSVQ